VEVAEDSHVCVEVVEEVEDVVLDEDKDDDKSEMTK
jgi:hypothetical protein